MIVVFSNLRFVRRNVLTLHKSRAILLWFFITDIMFFTVPSALVIHWEEDEL